MKIPKTPCYRCKHFLGSNSGKCEAFPGQVPEQIWSGKNLHRDPFPNDRGFRFEPNIAMEFLTISQVAKTLKVNPKTIYRAVWAKKIPVYKVGKALRIAQKDIEVFRK